MAENLKNEVNQFVVFILANETYGVDINSVREIITMQSITKVPGLTGYIEGVINLRGHVIPVFNIKDKFNLSNESLSGEGKRIVVIEVGENTIGIIVDGVSEVLRISKEVIEKPASMITAFTSTDYISGIAKLEEKMVILLDLNLVLSNEDKMQLEMIS